jgi:SAM-dependent methyltransferase
MSTREDWLPDYWRRSGLDLAVVVAEMHRQREQWLGQKLEAEVQSARRAIAHSFVRGRGLEVGAASRPFPLPAGASCFYGDVNDREILRTRCEGELVAAGVLDGQTLKGVADASLDFVIAAHVIEHLENPLGALRHWLRVLRPGGKAIVVVPDMRHTFDRSRPETPLTHVISDEKDGGDGTRRQAYEEHIRFVHIELGGTLISENRIESSIDQMISERFDTHFHAWTASGFRAILDHLCRSSPARVLVDLREVVNENIFVIERRAKRVDHFPTGAAEHSTSRA